jgi:hypothetical protein
LRIVEAAAQAGLGALLVKRLDGMAAHLGHQQLDRVGADIDDGASHGFHFAARLANLRGHPSQKRNSGAQQPVSKSRTREISD